MYFTKKPNGHLQKGYTVSLILAMEVMYSKVEFATVLFCAIILNFRIKKQSNSYLGQLVFISYPEKKQRSTRTHLCTSWLIHSYVYPTIKSDKYYLLLIYIWHITMPTLIKVLISEYMYFPLLHFISGCIIQRKGRVWEANCISHLRFRY